MSKKPNKSLEKEIKEYEEWAELHPYSISTNGDHFLQFLILKELKHISRQLKKLTQMEDLENKLR